jgi:cysteine desulfurase
MVYLDNAATTPVHPEVIAAIGAAMAEEYGNPSSRHAVGLAAERRLEQARATVAAALGVAPAQLVFTSGGTEANALAVLGVARVRARSRRAGHVLVSSIEHPSVLESARLLAEQGVAVEEIPVTRGGWVDPAEVEARVRSDTGLVAVMHVNNETGVRQPVEEIATRARARSSRCLILVDAVQSFSYLPTELRALGADIVTASAHKIQGPKGVGCLALGARAKLAPLWGGGDQEAGRRAGTENLPGIVGLARAVELARGQGCSTLASCAAALCDELARLLPAARRIGEPGRLSDHIVAIAIAGAPSEVLVNALEERGVCASSGSACHSRRALRSHVLDAMGLPRDRGVVRFSFSRASTVEEARTAARALADAARALGVA